MILKKSEAAFLATNAEGVCAEIMLFKELKRDDASKSHRA
jgi:hypothetical protein